MSNDANENETTYLAVYAGPGGPISVEIEATSVREALSKCEAFRKQWFDDAEDALGLAADASDEAIDAAIAAGGWVVAHATNQTDGYSLYIAAPMPEVSVGEWIEIQWTTDFSAGGSVAVKVDGTPYQVGVEVGLPVSDHDRAREAGGFTKLACGARWTDDADWASVESSRDEVLEALDEASWRLWQSAPTKN